MAYKILTCVNKNKIVNNALVITAFYLLFTERFTTRKHDNWSASQNTQSQILVKNQK